MRRRVSLIALILGLSGCGPCARHIDCRLRRDLASCKRGPDCQAENHCVSNGAPGRCSSACEPLGIACGLPSGARPDWCIVDRIRGHNDGCIATDHDPQRCRPITDSRGDPSCEDTNPPCAGCAMAFDTCVARSHCYGIVCF